MSKKRLLMAMAGAVLGLCGCGSAKGTTSTQEVHALFAARLPAVDPFAAAWSSKPEHAAALLPQDVTEPRLLKPGSTVVRVRALHDGSRLMLRLEWEDASEDKLLAPARFSDSVAVQFPARGGETPNAFMGEAGKPVRIHFWRAAWQDPAMNAPERVVKTLYPNSAVDHYPFDAAKTRAQRAALAVQYAPAVAAGNPGAPAPEGSGAPPTGTTQDLEAEGFGTLTPLPKSAPRSSGQGAWKKGRWSVALSLPIAGGALAAGKRSYVAFAVWDGGEKQVGARKMRSNWISIALDAAPRKTEVPR